MAFAHSMVHSRQLHQTTWARRGILGWQTAAAGSRQLTQTLRRHPYSTTSQLATASAADWRSAARRIAFKRLKEIQEMRPRTMFVDRVVRPTVNAMYTRGGQVQRLIPLFVAEMARRDKFAACLAGPSIYDHRLSEPEVHHTAVVQAVLTATHMLGSLVRLTVLAILFAPVLATAHLAMQLDIGRSLWLQLLRKTLELAGPAFMKWGQWASTRADIFPPDMCTELARLQSSAPAHSYRRTKAIVEKALGQPVDLLFDSFSKEPVASGSIGQIHRARLSERGALHTGVPAGTEVAVKVRHPGVGTAISRDFELMMAAASVAELLPSMKRLRIKDSLRQFAAPLQEQVDLAQEGRHLWQFNYNFRKQPHIRFPYPIYPLVSPEVLVETFETGEHITKYVEMGPGAPHNADLAALGSGAMLQMMLVDNFVHADLHPGNIMVHLDPPRGTRALYERVAERIGLKMPEKWNRPAIVLLDVGMATHLSDTERAQMVELFRAFSRLDGAAMALTALSFSGDEQGCPNPQAFIEDCRQMFDRIRKAHETEGAAFDTGAEAMSETLEIIRKNEVSLPGQICAVLVTTLVLEGWSNRLAPDHSVLGQVERLVAAEEASKRTLMERARAILRAVVASPTPLHVKVAST